MSAAVLTVESPERRNMPTAENLLSALESGQVLFFPQQPFTLTAQEEKLLDPALTDRNSKNISLNTRNKQLRGVTASFTEKSAVQGVIERYSQWSEQLIHALFPTYQRTLTIGLTSLRLHRVQTRQTSWRKDDSRLHVDAFPSRPNQGKRILRVFTNINPHNEARVWRVGEPFADMSQRLLTHIPRQWPVTASILQLLHITKSRRTAYDHAMLYLHDKMKADETYQQHAPQETIAFPPGSTWICFSDQALHAAMSGQFMLEQTFWLPVEGMSAPEKSPLRILEQQMGRRLV